VPGNDSTSDLLRRADQATRLAKGAGGGKIASFSPEMFERDTIRNDIELSLEGTINGHNDALVLHFLPEFGIRTGEILGTEALVRWQHPTHGLLMPDSFIGVLESINLAGKLGRLIMRAACAQFGLWRSHGVGRDAVLRVNVSPMELVANNIVDTVAATLDEFEIDPAAVCLEITERVVVQEIDATRRTLGQLKDIGVQIAIDDFGTGYSALTYLKTLPIDILKIDRAFVRDLGVSEQDQAIVHAIVALAHALGLEVVAEGLETATAARALLDLGCDRAQGFLLSRPVDGAAMESLLAQGGLAMDFDTV
jgi:diguanylate cyclase